jgi:hypothetical protein
MRRGSPNVSGQLVGTGLDQQFLGRFWAVNLAWGRSWNSPLINRSENLFSFTDKVFRVADVPKTLRKQRAWRREEMKIVLVWNDWSYWIQVRRERRAVRIDVAGAPRNGNRIKRVPYEAFRFHVNSYHGICPAHPVLLDVPLIG